MVSRNTVAVSGNMDPTAFCTHPVRHCIDACGCNFLADSRNSVTSGLNSTSADETSSFAALQRAGTAPQRGGTHAQQGGTARDGEVRPHNGVVRALDEVVRHFNAVVRALDKVVRHFNAVVRHRNRVVRTQNARYDLATRVSGDCQRFCVWGIWPPGKDCALAHICVCV